MDELKFVEVEKTVKLVDSRLSEIEQKLANISPKFLVQTEIRLEEFQRELADMRNVYSNPNSSLNRVLDGVLLKVKEFDKYITRQKQQPSIVSDLPSA